jgi:hypothetical protein
MLPFVFYITTSTILVNNDGTSPAMMEILNPTQIYISTYMEMILTYVVTTVVCIGAAWICGRKRDVI